METHTDAGTGDSPSQGKKPYERPELLNYGALTDVTRLYNLGPCQGICHSG